MSTYSGLMVRDNFQDVGIIPSTGDYWVSPDIIPYGMAVLDPKQAVKTFGGPDLAKPVVSGGNNNIYVRCKNIAAAPKAANVNLYYTPYSLMMLPTFWQPVTTPVSNNNFITTDGKRDLLIPVGGIGLVQAPFNVVGSKTGEHYCFVAIVNNDGIPSPYPGPFNSNAAYAAFVMNNPNIAQRNVTAVAGSIGTYTTSATFGNINPIGSTFFFSLVGTNLPSGTTWSAQCDDQRLPQPFSASGVFSSQGTASAQLIVPANIGAGNALMAMTFTYTAPNNQPFPPGTKIVKPSYYQQPTAQEESAMLFEEERAVIRQHRVAARSEGAEGFETLQLILLGSVETQLNCAG
jgi:hypothetical protein